MLSTYANNPGPTESEKQRQIWNEILYCFTLFMVTVTSVLSFLFLGVLGIYKTSASNIHNIFLYSFYAPLFCWFYPLHLFIPREEEKRNLLASFQHLYFFRISFIFKENCMVWKLLVGKRASHQSKVGCALVFEQAREQRKRLFVLLEGSRQSIVNERWSEKFCEW